MYYSFFVKILVKVDEVVVVVCGGFGPFKLVGRKQLILAHCLVCVKNDKVK